MEILPKLPKGVTYGLHDIFLPQDYPNEWNNRYYNEQYLLGAYLLGGANGDEILCPSMYLSSPHFPSLDILDPIFTNEKLLGSQRSGGIFWMKRG